MPDGEIEPGALRTALPLEERLRSERERAFLYPIEGEDLITEIQTVEPKRFPQVVQEALAFREGLPFSLRDYDLNNPEVLLDLQNRFTSVEAAIERPSPWYLDTAVKERIRREIRSIKQRSYQEQRSLTTEEKNTITQLMKLNNHWEGRKTIDAAFIQRMLACEDAETVAALLARAPDYRPSVKPDKGHWQGALQDEFGEKVDRVLREIVRMGMSPEDLAKVRLTPIKDVPEAVYATGFTDTKTFKKWLSHLLETVGGRLDIVWFAWRLALLWEIPAQIGAKEDKQGKIKLADPPIGNDLHTWITHLEKKRASEWGVDARGKRMRESKYLSHVGYPLSLGKIGPLCESFLREAKVEFPTGSGEQVSLWQLWWEKNMKVGGNFEKDRNILPWALTELQPRGLDTEELPLGSFGFWLLTRSRAFKVSEDIRSRPSLNELSNPDFFASRLRNWEKVLGTYEDKAKKLNRQLNPNENPRTWWVAGLLMAHHVEANKKIPLVKESPDELAYRSYFPGEIWSTVQKGQMGGRSPSIWEILNHAYQCGFLRKVDIDWLVTKLNLPKPMGASPY